MSTDPFGAVRERMRQGKQPAKQPSNKRQRKKQRARGVRRFGGRGHGACGAFGAEGAGRAAPRGQRARG
eukprot:3937954-Prymnesium_polylepis.1